MTAKFTPGPWGAVNNGVYWEVSTPWEVGGNIEKHCPSVAFVWALLPDASEPELNENQEANARLIAAAPEMFELLKECVDGTFGNCTDWNERARKIIAKAKGE